MNWNFSEAVYQLAESDLADRTVLIHEDELISYALLKQRACCVASWLLSLRLPPGSHIGHYMRNSNAYTETCIGAGLAGMSHLNVNFRYREDELADLCNGLDIRVLVYDSEFADRVSRIRDRLSQTIAFVEVGPGNDFALPYRSLYDHDTSGFERRTSPDDLILIATGGTTGLPKGTQWRHEDMWFKLNASMGVNMAALELAQHPASMEEHVANVASMRAPPPIYPLCPLMHGTGLLLALLGVVQGCAVVTSAGSKFDPARTLELIDRHQVGSVVLVGDAFAQPLLDTLENGERTYSLDSLQAIISSGSILSDENKTRLKGHRPGLIIIDTLGSTESVGFGVATDEAGVFEPMPTTCVFDDQLQEVVPGSDTIGIAYSAGYSPIGYYKDPEKSAETFVEINGEKYVKTGDRCTVREDGMLVLLGRDSTVINTGGEKVYTVEVERVLVEQPHISDAIVVGLPHPRFGSMVVAVVEGPALTADNIDGDDIMAFCRGRLADYKVPKHVFAATSLQRTPSGKPDYDFISEYAAQQLARSRSPESRAR